MIKKVIFFSFVCILASCGRKGKLTIFEIGDSREKVINTIVSDFFIDGEQITKNQVLDLENGNHLTLYNCNYHGQNYKKFRVYYSDEIVRRIEIKIDKDNIRDVLGMLESDFGHPHRTRLPYLFNTRIDANVFMGTEQAIILFGQNEYYEILVVSGEQKDLINRIM